ncbi:uncharacterized protein JCM10292_006839 [Rhodotorula paludigena]|uniref:uncharacterized protein n=1 Tax=Rhodotorula paludigena TaxID=86838 RepID=UPI00316BFD28
MPHKRQKRSIRLERSSAQGMDNPPTAADSLLPITSTLNDDAGAAAVDDGKKSNKRRRKGAGSGRGDAPAADASGASKSAFRVINAVKLREEYHAKKKRKLEDEQKGKNPNQQKKTASTSMTPLPYESLSSFNRRVEQEMRGSVRAAIKDASASAQRKKDRKGKAKKGDGDDGDGAEDEDEEEVRRGRDGKPLTKKPKLTPEEAVDPHAKKARAPVTADAGSATDAARSRTGRTEFASADIRRRLDDVVQAPPTLADPARKGLMAKVLGPGGAAACGVSSEGQGSFKLAGAEAPVGSSRLPINPAMKALLDAERERAVKMYRQLKEQREAEKN